MERAIPCILKQYNNDVWEPKESLNCMLNFILITILHLDIVLHIQFHIWILHKTQRCNYLEYLFSIYSFLCHMLYSIIALMQLCFSHVVYQNPNKIYCWCRYVNLVVAPRFSISNHVIEKIISDYHTIMKTLFKYKRIALKNLKITTSPKITTLSY
jgi:hypothetical protein